MYLHRQPPMCVLVGRTVSHRATKDLGRHKLLSSNERGGAMPEAVIVATARSPIGRAFKGSLTSIRPDDLTAQMVTKALSQVPQLDPGEIDDLILGCGLPGGEQGFNLARGIAGGLRYQPPPGANNPRN